MAEFRITDTVDITDVVCPVTFVKAKVALEELEEGFDLVPHNGIFVPYLDGIKKDLTLRDQI